MASKKSAPKSTQEAVGSAVAVLNSVTVPEGTFPGTDTGKGSSEAGGDAHDHTLWGIVRDHNATDPAVYYRSVDNPSLQRLRLRDLPLAAGQAARTMAVGAGAWFIDASSRLAETTV